MSALSWISAAGYFSGAAHDAPVWIGIGDGRIEAIETSPPDRIMIEPEGYLLPLLSDTHAHVYMNPWPLDPAKRVKPGSGGFDDEVSDALERLGEALRHGVGFVRDMGDPFGINLAVKEAAPIVLQVPGPAIHRPRKYGRHLGVSRETIADVIALIEALAEDPRVDFIKLTATGIVDFKEKRVRQAPQFSAEELTTAVRCARDRGYKTAAHCSGADGIDIVLDAGIDFIEHGYFIRPDQLQRAADLQCFWTPTFAPVLAQFVNRDECGWDQQTTDAIAGILADHRKSFAHAWSLGAAVLPGTDGGSPGVPIGPAIHAELSQMQQAGIPAQRLLRLATADAADGCQPAGYSGRVRVGDPADFAVYSASPWANVDNLATIKNVYRDGRLC